MKFKKDVRVFKNYRVYDNPENPLEFMTSMLCSTCGAQTENYILLVENNTLICKGCLSEFINILNEDFQELMKNSKRG